MPTRPRGGTIDALFDAGDALDDDLAAADTLAQAFAPEPSRDPLGGRPAREAGNELSLDRVFRQPTPAHAGEASAGGFSFDQFFAGERTEDSEAGRRKARRRRRHRAIQCVAQRAEKAVKIAVVNGPNLNLLGTREPALYGHETLDDVERSLRSVAKEIGVELQFAQHNGEGELIDAIQGLRGQVDGVVINAGAYTHSSLAIRDALTAIAVPFVEVHVTNVYAREPERRHSMLAGAAVGSIVGLGAYGYELALRGLTRKVAARV